MTNQWLFVAECLLGTCFLTSCGSNRSQSAITSTQVESSTAQKPKNNSDEITISPDAQRELQIEVARVQVGPYVSKTRAKGRIVIPDNAVWRVGVLTEGRIEAVYFGLGDPVQRGQVLARIHSHEVHEVRAAYQAALTERSRLESAEALAQKNADRSRRLYELKAESVSQTEAADQELINAHSAFHEAEISVHREKAHLEDILGLRADSGANEDDLIAIRAPASGRILQKNVTLGATISPSTDAFVIGNLSRLWMLASVDAATLAKLHVGQRAEVVVPDVPNASCSGTVTNLGQEFDPVTRLMQVRIEVKNAANRLRPEMLASAEFDLGNGTPTLFISQDAVQQVNGEDVVFVRESPARFRVQAIQKTETLQGKVRVLAGLEPGEDVIARGSFIAKSQLLKSSIDE